MHEDLNPTDRYVVLCEGNPVYTTDQKTYLGIRLLSLLVNRSPGEPFRYTVLDYGIPYIVDADDLENFLDRLPE